MNLLPGAYFYIPLPKVIDTFDNETFTLLLDGKVPDYITYDPDSHRIVVELLNITNKDFGQHIINFRLRDQDKATSQHSLILDISTFVLPG
jgi:hypothetical protein